MGTRVGRNAGLRYRSLRGGGGLCAERPDGRGSDGEAAGRRPFDPVGPQAGQGIHDRACKGGI